MIVDRKTLYVLGFNYTAIDVNKSRSFGVITKKPELVREAIKLFEADSLRVPYTPGPKTFLVSPLNARERLSVFLKGARRESDDLRSQAHGSDHDPHPASARGGWG